MRIRYWSIILKASSNVAAAGLGFQFDGYVLTLQVQYITRRVSLLLHIIRYMVDVAE